MKMQYVAVRFSTSSRQYTYQWEGEPLKAGDRVVVPTDRGPQTVTVVYVSLDKPNFACKSIAGKERPIAQAATPPKRDPIDDALSEAMPYKPSMAEPENVPLPGFLKDPFDD